MYYQTEGSIRSLSEAYKEVLNFTKEGPKAAKKKVVGKPSKEEIEGLKEALRRSGQWEMLAMIENAEDYSESYLPDPRDKRMDKVAQLRKREEIARAQKGTKYETTKTEDPNKLYNRQKAIEFKTKMRPQGANNSSMVENAAAAAGGSVYGNAAKKSSEMARTHGRQAQHQGTMAGKTAQAAQSAGNAGPRVKSKTLDATINNPAVVEGCDCKKGQMLMDRSEKGVTNPGHMGKLIKGLEKVKSKIENKDGHIPGKTVSAAVAEEAIHHLVSYGYVDDERMAIRAFEEMDAESATDIFLEIVEDGTSPTLNEHHTDTLFFIEKGMELLENFKLNESVNLFGTILEEEGMAGDYYTAMDALLEAENFAELMISEVMSMADMNKIPGGTQGQRRIAQQRQRRREEEERVKSQANQRQSQTSQNQNQGQQQGSQNTNQQQQQKRQQAQQQRTQQSQSSQQSSHGAPRPKQPSGGSGSGPTSGAPKQPASKTPPKEGIGRTIGREFVGKRYGDVFSKDKNKRNQAMVRVGVDATKNVARGAVGLAKRAFSTKTSGSVGVSHGTPIV